MMRRLGIIVLASVLTAVPAAAQTVVLDLERTVSLATGGSLPALKYQSLYDASRYAFLSWEASRKPQFTLESTPLMFERYMTQRYLSQEDIDVYRQQQYLYSQAGISATQVFEPLGGEFYGSTQLGWLKTFGDESQAQFMTVPLAVGYRQDLLFFNPLKWDKKIEPLKLTQAEKELSYGIETASGTAVEKFFTLALAQDQYRMAEEYLASCDTIYAIAERRYRIASISKAELGILELERVNATTTLANARIARQRAVEDLATYLGMEKGSDIELIVPSVPYGLRVDAAEAVEHARENNPNFIEYQVALEEARRDAEKARIEKNLNLSLDVSVGMNQVSDRFSTAYARPLMQDMAVVSVSVPLLDWGKRKSAWQAAVSRVEATERAAMESARDTELDVRLTVNEFNERLAIIETARQALEIAEDVYTQTLQRFIKGQADVYNLSLAQSYWQSARQNSIASLQNYWLSYYNLRRLTLYDYQHRKPIRYAK
ncbi:MAG: TolC family protein [Bacteroidales bacterium]|nr:TolC family protein [Bacteroidales bacterium]